MFDPYYERGVVKSSIKGTLKSIQFDLYILILLKNKCFFFQKILS